MNCPVCGGDFRDQTVRYCACDSDAPVIVENVPARVCDQCGERLFSTSTAKQLEMIQSKNYSPAGHVRIPKFDLQNLRQARSNSAKVVDKQRNQSSRYVFSRSIHVSTVRNALYGVAQPHEGPGTPSTSPLARDQG